MINARRLCGLLSCLMLLSLLASCREENPYPPIETVGLAEGEILSEGKEGDYSYALYARHAEITAYEGKEASLILPKTLGGKPVKAVGENAFANHETLTSVTLPESLIKIGRYAFQDCKALTTVKWNDALEVIDDFAFRRTALSELVCPPKLYGIGREAFASSAITKVEMSDSVTKVRDYAFHACTALTEIRFSPRLTEIGSRLFNGCSELSEVVIPTTVTKIGDYAFGSCANLDTVVIPETVKSPGEGIFVSSGNVTVIVKAEGEMSKWCSRNAVAFKVATEEEWLKYYPQENA